MNFKKVVFLLLLVFNFVSCDKNEIITPTDVNSVPVLKSNHLTEPEPNFSTPVFPVIALHIIYREFLHQNPEFTTYADMQVPFSKYLEDRLIELYPEISYEGMMQTAINEYDDYALASVNYADALNEVEEVKKLKIIPTLKEEIEATAMTQDEIAMWNDLEQYATSDKKIKRSELDNLLIQYGQMDKGIVIGTIVIGTWGIVAIAGGGVAVVAGGYFLFRALQARSRALSTATNHFGNIRGGEQSDAYKHIYASMHLRRYAGRAIAQLFGWGQEAIINRNQCHDREMDYHNNRVGRSTKYSTFRNGTSRHDWGRWGRRVRDFVNNPGANGTIHSSWANFNTTTNLPNCSTVDSDVASTSTSKFIYYR